MLAKCVNPVCLKPLHYLRDGTIFHVDRPTAATDGGKNSHNVEHFWLCGDCCQSMTVLYDPKAGVRVVPRGAHPGSRAA